MSEQHYCHEDYKRHPGKYTLFRTARVAEAIQSIPQLKVGELVNIRYFATTLNKTRGNVDMPVYEVRMAGEKTLEDFPALLYACALKEFCL